MKMNTKQSKYPKSLIGGVFLVFLLLSVKLTLTAALFLFKKDSAGLPPFPAEVLAEDSRAKPQKATVPKDKATSSPPAPHQPASVAVGTQPVMDLAFYLERKEEELKQKEERLRQKEEYLVQMEQELERKFKELIPIQKEIQAYKAEKEETQNNKIRSLAKIYGTMKPKEAAKLLENLDENLVVQIISTMNSDEAANILAGMDVKKAAKISESLSQR